MDKEEFEKKLYEHGYNQGVILRLCGTLYTKVSPVSQYTLDEIIRMLPVTDGIPKAAIDAYLNGYSKKVIAELLKPEVDEVYPFGMESDPNFWRAYDFTDDEILNYIHERVKLFLILRKANTNFYESVLTEAHNGFHCVMRGKCTDKALAVKTFFGGYSLETARAMIWPLEYLPGITKLDLYLIDSYELGYRGRTTFVDEIRRDYWHSFSSDIILRKLRAGDYYTELVKCLSSHPGDVDSREKKTPNIEEDAAKIFGVFVNKLTVPADIFS